MSSSRVRLVIADDHPVVREGLRVMFSRFDDCEVVGEAGDGPEAVALARDLKTDAALVDLRLPGADGVAVARNVSRGLGQIRCRV